MDANASQSEDTQPNSLREILEALNRRGGFEAVVLASADGLLIAHVSTRYDSETLAALVAMLRKVSVETQQRLDLTAIDEITIRSQDRVRLVCRQIATGRDNLILVTIVSSERRYYRLATNRAIKQIERLLS